MENVLIVVIKVIFKMVNNVLVVKNMDNYVNCVIKQDVLNVCMGPICLITWLVHYSV